MARHKVLVIEASSLPSVLGDRMGEQCWSWLVKVFSYHGSLFLVIIITSIAGGSGGPLCDVLTNDDQM